MNQLLKHVKLVIVAFCAVFAGVSSTQVADAVDSGAIGRRIVVSIAQQRVYAYDGNRLILSTKANIRGTRRGSFRVQSKYPVASAFTLGWKLPHWMGIYYAGGLENGFHGPAFTARGGRTMASLGCIVMPAESARTLYRWARMGTRVTIR
jgi:lipoprotein-anchoring transpeptidase ErfK/SrfK